MAKFWTRRSFTFLTFSIFSIKFSDSVKSFWLLNIWVKIKDKLKIIINETSIKIKLVPIMWSCDKIKTKIKDNVFIGSNSSLVAPLTIGENSVVGAGSVITKNVKKKTLALTRSLQTEIKNYKRKSK